MDTQQGTQNRAAKPNPISLYRLSTVGEQTNDFSFHYALCGRHPVQHGWQRPSALLLLLLPLLPLLLRLVRPARPAVGHANRLILNENWIDHCRNLGTTGLHYLPVSLL